MSAILAWMLTYLVHSTLLFAAAWAAGRVLGEKHLALQERILRFALVGAILTSTLQVALPLEPASGSLSLVAEAPAASVHAVAPQPLVLPPPRPVAPKLRWAPLLFALWALGAAGSALRLGVASLRLQRVLGGGRALVEGGLPRTVRRLAETLGLVRAVELRASPRITVPFAAGIRRPRVCIPERVLTDLGTLEQEGLCAHELAHLQRGDPGWVLVYRIVAATLFFQPLNDWAARQLGELSECLSDDLAARATGRAPELARSLVKVADWTTENAALPAATALRAPCGLGRRIERLEKLMREPSCRRPHPVTDRRWLPFAALAVFAGTTLLPGMSGRAAAAPEEAELARVEEQLEEAAEERTALQIQEQRRREQERTAERAEIRELEHEVERDPDVEHEVERDLDIELEEAMRHIEAEMEAAAAEIEVRSEEIARVLSEVKPSEEELRELESELEELGEKLGESIREELEATRAPRHEEMRRHHHEQMRELRERMQNQAARLRLSPEEQAEIRRRIRESLPQRDRLRELSRELRRLTQRLVRSMRLSEPPEPPEAPEPSVVPAPPEPPEPPPAPDPAVRPDPRRDEAGRVSAGDAEPGVLPRPSVSV